MLRPLTLLGAALLAVVVSGGCADDVSPAARVGDATISTDRLLDAVAEWAAVPDSPRGAEMQGSGTAWGYPIEPVAGVLQEQLILTILDAAFDDLGLEVTPELRDATNQSLRGDPTVGPSFAGFSSDFADAYVDAYAKGFAVQESMTEVEFGEVLTTGARDIEVNPRFGTWDANLQRLVLPEGPRPAPNSEVLEPLARP